MIVYLCHLLFKWSVDVTKTIYFIFILINFLMIFYRIHEKKIKAWYICLFIPFCDICLILNVKFIVQNIVNKISRLKQSETKDKKDKKIVKSKKTKSTKSQDQEEDEIYEIYLITNSLNNMKYVGITKNGYMNRFKKHCKADSRLGLAIKKVGVENFTVEVIMTCKGKEKAFAIEKKFINLLDTYVNGYNNTKGNGDEDIIIAVS